MVRNEQSGVWIVEDFSLEQVPTTYLELRRNERVAKFGENGSRPHSLNLNQGLQIAVHRVWHKSVKYKFS